MPEPFSRLPSSPYVAYLEESRRPWACLIFILPFLLAYHAGIWLMQSDGVAVANGADVMLSKLLNIAYYAGVWFFHQLFPGQEPGDSLALWFLQNFGSLFALFMLVCVLLLRQHLSGAVWKVRVRTLALMFGESLLFALPPFALAWAVNFIFFLRADTGDLAGWLAGVVLSMGAGIYEELLFRVILMGFLFWLGERIFRLRGPALQMTAILGQAFIFSAFHYLPWSGEEFMLPVFSFRMIAGVYFAYIYQERNFGIAAGAHALYDVIAVTLNDFN